MLKRKLIKFFLVLSINLLISSIGISNFLPIAGNEYTSMMETEEIEIEEKKEKTQEEIEAEDMENETFSHLSFLSIWPNIQKLYFYQQIQVDRGNWAKLCDPPPELS